MQARLANDCFALPPGVDWTPVDTALERLISSVSRVATPEICLIQNAEGRVAAEDIVAKRAHPAHRNSAVDGYAVCFETPQRLRYALSAEIAAAGHPAQSAIAPGQAMRIFTGAKVPAGTDAVILQEDTEVAGREIACDRDLKPGANIRPVGEDTNEGEVLLKTGQVLTERALAHCVSAGVSEVLVYKPLRIGVLSTGDELVSPGAMASDAQVFDANHPLLSGLVGRWGYHVIDLGRAKDDAATMESSLRDAIGMTDAILVSGGASAGDEDHVSATLGKYANRHTWRIAMKPGRPLALATWDGVPIFGLPGNPIAAYVCTLIFARLAFQVLQGRITASPPQGFKLPAGFEKSKKQGRSEFLRARVTQSGDVEVFKSEGSGRISGLAWADGLVELGHDAREIKRGDLVRYIPFANFD